MDEKTNMHVHAGLRVCVCVNERIRVVLHTGSARSRCSACSGHDAPLQASGSGTRSPRKRGTGEMDQLLSSTMSKGGMSCGQAGALYFFRYPSSRHAAPRYILA